MNPTLDANFSCSEASKRELPPAVNCRRRMLRRTTRSWALPTGSLALLMSGLFHAEGIDWSGQTWDENPASPVTTLNVNGLNQLEVTSSSSTLFGRAHIGTSPSYRAAATPWMQIKFLETGNASRKGFFFEDETTGPLGSAGGWLQIISPNAFASNYSLFYNDYDADLLDNGAINMPGPTGVTINTGVARSVGERTFTIGRRADGTVDILIDGSLITSLLAAQFNPNYFGDIYLASRGETTTFTSFAIGTDYVFGVPVPEASSAIPVAVAGLGLVAFALHRRRSV